MAYQSNIEKRLSLLEVETKPQRQVMYCWLDSNDNEAEKVKTMQSQNPDRNIIAIGWNH